MAAPITLTLGDRQAQLTPQTIAANLTFGSDGEGSLAPQFDAKTALTGVESSLVDAAQVPRDATYDVVNGKLVLVPARQGRGVNSKLLARDLAKLVRNGGPRVIPVRLAAAPPQVTTEQVTGLGIKENVASFTSTFECCLPRVTNIRQMAADIDGQLVLPGQTFSLNDVVGERTAEGGYVLGAPDRRRQGDHRRGRRRLATRHHPLQRGLLRRVRRRRAHPDGLPLQPLPGGP